MALDLKILSKMQLRFEKYKMWHWQNLGSNVTLYLQVGKKLCMQDGMRLAIIYGDGRRENVLHDKIPARMPPPHPPLGLNSGSPLSIHNLNLTLPEKIVGICYVVLCSHYFGCMKWTSQCLLYSGWNQILCSNHG